MEIRKICVLGTGTIGYQIAHQAAIKGYKVCLRDIDDGLLKNAEEKIKKETQKFFVDKGKLTQEEGNAVIERLSFTSDLKEAVTGADVVIESIFEDMELKKRVFKELDEICAPSTIIGSNTSSLSITEIGSLAKRQDRIIGIHFSNPVTVMKLCEIILGANTSDETLDIARDLAIKMGKEPVIVKDSPGFITTRLFVTLVNEAAKIVYEGIAGPADIDRALELALGHPMGPLKTADMNIEIAYKCLKYFREEFGDEYRPCPIFKKMINAGHLGVKSGRGFYEYRKSA